MLDVNLIRKDPDFIKQSLSYKNINPQLVDDFLFLDETWRAAVKICDDLRAKLNTLSKERKIDEAKKVKEELKIKEAGLPDAEVKRNAALNKLPNLPEDGALRGKGEGDNQTLREVGPKPNLSKPKDYLELAEKLGLLDVRRAAEVSGSRFGYLLNQAVLLEFALVDLAFKKLIKNGFHAIIPPVMIKPEVYRGMGRLGGAQAEERYYLPGDNLFLVGSAEHTMGPFHMNETFAEDFLPRRYVGFSTCFRREAGSYGKDTKGILRVHQFDKVEMFSFAKPDESKKEHEFLLSMQEELMQDLKLPYRVVKISTGDMGWTDAAQFDIETWLPGQGNYRETHSCSNTTDFQARGINVKYKTKKGAEFVHMLNATALAIGRMIIAIIENYQNEDGSITIPDILQHYVGSDVIK